MSKEENIINAPWNMAQIFYIELARLIRFKDSAYLLHDIKGWNDGLKAIFRRIYFKLNNSERQEFKKLFSEIDDLRKLYNTNQQSNIFLTREIKELLENIDMRIVEVMDKYKMIFPDVEIKSLENYEKSLGL